jgi:hypothetical protein
MTLDARQYTRTPCNYTWQQLYTLVGTFTVVLLPGNGFRYAFHMAEMMMNDIVTGDEHYFDHHAFSLLAARFKKLSQGNTTDPFSARDAYLMLYNLTGHPYPQHTAIHELMNHIHKNTEHDLRIPPDARQILSNIVIDYDTGREHQDLDSLRDTLLNYIQVARDSNADPSHKTHVVQACCYVLGLFH